MQTAIVGALALNKFTGGAVTGVLTSLAGDTVTVLGFTLDGPATRSIDAVSRAFSVGVGGTLQIAADQPEGDYSADFTVTANYQ